jgi:carboxylesterase
MPEIMAGGTPFLLPGGTTGCLLVHGYTASPQEMRFLGGRLNKQEFTALGIRLAGHATHVRHLHRIRWWDWIASVEDGIHILRGMCDKVVLVGLSLGGALCLTASTANKVDAVIALSTPFRLPPDLRLRLLKPILRPLSLVMPTYQKGKSDWVDQTLVAERVAYSEYSVRAAEEVRRLLSEMRSKLTQIEAPVLLIHSQLDQLVPHADMDEIFALLETEKQREMVDKGSHNIVGDADRETVVELIVKFITQVVT